MPHIVVNVWPGRSDEEKRALANRIALDVAEVFQMIPSTSRWPMRRYRKRNGMPSASGRLMRSWTRSTKSRENRRSNNEKTASVGM